MYCQMLLLVTMSKKFARMEELVTEIGAAVLNSTQVTGARQVIMVVFFYLVPVYRSLVSCGVILIEAFWSCLYFDSLTVQ